MAKQYLDEAGVSQVWRAIKARFLDKNITTAQTVTGGITFSEVIKFSKNIDIGKSTIAAGSNASAITVTLPSKTGTLALASDIPSVSGFAKLTGDNVWTGDNTFNKNVSGLTFTASSGSNTTIYGPDTIANSGITLTLPKKAGTFLLSTDVGVKNGVASLDANGRVPTSQLPSYVDDIIDCYATYDVGTTGTLSNIKLYSDAAHKNLITGEGGKEYIDITEGNPGYEFRWTGTVWAQVGGSPLILGTVTGTAFDGEKGSELANKFSDMAADMGTINTTLANKVDKKTTAGSHLYSHAGSTQNEVAYGTAATANNIVQRDAAGQINLPTAEPSDNQAISKKWFTNNLPSEQIDHITSVVDDNGQDNRTRLSVRAIKNDAGLVEHRAQLTFTYPDSSGEKQTNTVISVADGGVPAQPEVTVKSYEVTVKSYDMHLYGYNSITFGAGDANLTTITFDSSSLTVFDGAVKFSNSYDNVIFEQGFTSNNGFDVTGNAHVNGQIVINSLKIHNTTLNADEGNTTREFNLPTSSTTGTLALTSDITSAIADTASITSNNDFTGKNTFTQSIDIDDPAATTSYGYSTITYAVKTSGGYSGKYILTFPKTTGTLLVDADITAIPEATLTKILG